MSLNDPNSLDTSTADLSREFLRDAYPDRSAEWIERQVAESVRRINQAVPQRGHSVPAASRRRRGWLLFLAVVAVIVVVVIVLRESIAAAAFENTGVIVLAVVAVLAGATTLWMRVREKRAKVLSCRVRINTRFSPDAGERLKFTGPDAAAVEDPGVVVVRIKNLGGAVITPEDYITPLTLRFPGRRVRSVDVTASDPPPLQDAVAKHPDFESKADTDFITLPKVRLAPDDSVYLMVLLSGTKRGERYAVHVEGQLDKGRITPESNIPWIRRRTVAGVGVTTLAAGMLAVVLLINNVRFAPLPEGLVCVPGRLTVEGSSAFGPAAIRAATEYQTYCRGSTIDVSTPGSGLGVQRLHDAPESERPNRLALSDGKASSEFAGLVPHPVAVVPFTFVVNNRNNEARVDGISRQQARNIFTGQVSAWSEITGDRSHFNDEVRVVVRPDDSGTRRTLQEHVLWPGDKQAEPSSDTCEARRPGADDADAIVCVRSTTTDVLNRTAAVRFAVGYADMGDVSRTDGVKALKLDGRNADMEGIRAGYPFWTVEYVYSHGQPKNGSLAEAFIDYLKYFLLEAQQETEDGGKQPDYFACGAADVQRYCERRDR
ncbi:phosphate ABC transporter substrate-binding protein [Kibdelosporangium aridum]|uniref:Phosphate ABC transporter substrate-binding protein n=1 Tax=Kibdelosporangium aridum TaxID=2030 RepID=A0A428ZEF0_KIBAR|nr:substrate-binding domain-containing protein [Kibdelosporangium aridum]RSM86348.1 phosphate ABC transporter substrate-binding protein [Kibdelosporangium aridum]